jgi:hypothetical protein
MMSRNETFRLAMSWKTSDREAQRVAWKQRLLVRLAGSHRAHEVLDRSNLPVE